LLTAARVWLIGGWAGNVNAMGGRCVFLDTRARPSENHAKL
jgi:hypothetical protein